VANGQEGREAGGTTFPANDQAAVSLLKPGTSPSAWKRGTSIVRG
jgi:hypothetical protein